MAAVFEGRSNSVVCSVVRLCPLPFGLFYRKWDFGMGLIISPKQCPHGLARHERMGMRRIHHEVLRPLESARCISVRPTDCHQFGFQRAAREVLSRSDSLHRRNLILGAGNPGMRITSITTSVGTSSHAELVHRSPIGIERAQDVLPGLARRPESRRLRAPSLRTDARVPSRGRVRARRA
jgi:hypothetical protein